MRRSQSAALSIPFHSRYTRSKSSLSHIPIVKPRNEDIGGFMVRKAISKRSQQVFEFIDSFIRWYRNEYSYTYAFYCKYHNSKEPIIQSSINEINKFIRNLFLKQYAPRKLKLPECNVARAERSFDFIRYRITQMYNEYLEHEIVRFIAPIPDMIEIDESLYVLELLLSLIHAEGSIPELRNRIVEVRRVIPPRCKNAHIQSFLDYAYMSI